MTFVVQLPEDVQDKSNEHTNISQKAFSSRIFVHIAFIFLLAVRLYVDRFTDVLLLLWLYASVYYSYRSLCDDTLTRSRDGFVHLSLLFSLITTCHLILLHFALRERGLLRIFMFMLPYSPLDNLWSVLWTCILLDLSIKIVILQFKCILVAIPKRRLSTYKLGKALAMLECLSLLIRTTYPCFVWISFFMELGTPLQSSVSKRAMLAVLYGLLKVASLYFCMRSLKSIWRSLCSLPPPFKVETVSSQRCLLCSKDYERGGVLPCNHAMCESCAETWCSRHNFCPICNIKLLHDPKWRDGSMDLFVQLY